MATADPSIFNALMPRKSAFDYATEFEQQDMRREQQGMARQQNALALEQAQQARADDRALRNVLSSGLDFDTKEGQAALYKANPKAAPGFLKSRQEAVKAQGEITKLTGENLDAGLSRYRKMLDSVADPQSAVQWLQAQYSDPVVGPVMSKMAPFEEAVKRIPSTPAEFARWRQESSMGMEAYQKHVAPKPETLDLGGKKVVIDLNPNSPTFKQQIIEQQVSNPATDMLIPDGNGGYTQNAPLIEAKKAVAKSGASSVNVNTGQKGLDNEFKLRGEFKQEPVYKAHQEMQAAYSQIQQALKQATPAGDLAGATKIMKLLDPNSVVRESELGMAMAATGLLDRAQNYASNIISGNKLTPKQRTEFQALANALMSESVKHYNSKRSEYERLGGEYGLNAGRSLGPNAAPVSNSSTWPTPDAISAELARRQRGAQ